MQFALEYVKINLQNKEGGESMEEKIFLILVEMNQRLGKMEQKIGELSLEMNRRFSHVYQEIDNLREETNQNIGNLRQELNESMENFHQEMLDRQLVFEEEYGKKIDVIFDCVQLQQKNNLQILNKMEELEKKVLI